MDSRFLKMFAWMLYAAILFPTIGPMVDHHFAERQPGHLHFGTAAVHAHNYGHPHGHAEQGSQDSKAVYNFESGQTINLVHTGDELGLTAFLRFSPDSIYVLPNGSGASRLEIPPKSLDRPPTITA